MGTHTAHGTDRLPRRAGTSSALALHASATSAHALTTLEQRLDSALVTQPEGPARPRQLSWNGVRVSEELQRYAASVARGEQLAPYRGPVLARSETVFPWNLEATPLHAQRRRVDPPWSAWQLAVLALLFVGVVLGGGATLLGDSDGAELPQWTSGVLEPRVAQAPASAPAPVEVTSIDTTPPRKLTARASRATRTVPASMSARSASPTRAAVRAHARPSETVALAPAPEEDSTLFVEAPSF
jgi:hypothetical protein